jgi:hypothetical protein
MAKFIGNSKPSPIAKNRLLDLTGVYQRAVNQDGYYGIFCNSTYDTSMIQGTMVLAKLNSNKLFEFLPNNDSSVRLFNSNFYNVDVIDIEFSADKTYAVVFTNGVNGLKFFKLNSQGTYDELTQPGDGILSLLYGGDMSPDGQFVCARSNTSPYIEVYKRTGDTWARETLSSTNVLQPANDANFTGRMFDHYNLLHFSNGSTNDIRVMQVLERDSNDDTWKVRTDMTGLSDSKAHAGLDFYYDGTTYYYVCTDGGSPYISFFKTTDGINFTDLSSNITNKVIDPHYDPKWDPTGTYCFIKISNNDHAFGVYKRDGDNLNYLGPSAFDQFPPTASSTSRETTTWSHDSKYVINLGGGTSGSWMYERIGDNFYLVSSVVSNLDNVTPLSGDYLTPQNNVSIYKFVWL